jgi:hypothetical protein
MVLLRARVGQRKTDTGECSGSIGGEGNGEKVDEPYIPRWAVIEESPTGYILLTIDEKGCEFIETWSDSIQEAKLDAAEQFSVDMDAWVSVTGNDS